MVPRARRSPGLASYPPSPPRSALTGASSGSRSWSSSARDGAAGSLFRKRVAVSAGGRSLYEIGRDSGGAAFFGTPPPVPLLGQREGDPAGVGLCVRRRGFFVPLFQGGFSMTNRPFCEIPAMQCPVCGQAARVLVCEEARPPVLADVVFCYHCAPRHASAQVEAERRPLHRAQGVHVDRDRAVNRYRSKTPKRWPGRWSVRGRSVRSSPG